MARRCCLYVSSGTHDTAHACYVQPVPVARVDTASCMRVRGTREKGLVLRGTRLLLQPLFSLPQWWRRAKQTQWDGWLKQPICRANSVISTVVSHFVMELEECSVISLGGDAAVAGSQIHYLFRVLRLVVGVGLEAP